MFGSSIFRNDPFFNRNSDVMAEFDRMEQRMDQMFQNFGMPMVPGVPTIMGPPPAVMDNRQLMQNRSPHPLQPFGAGANMFGNMFGNMDAMNTMVSQMRADPNTQFSSSSRVISYSSDGSGAPRVYEASSSSTQGPGGVRQTRRSERNSETGLDRMAVGHHIYDRGHVVERSRNRRTNDQEENQEFLNMDEEEKEAFHEEWQRKSRAHAPPHTRELALEPNSYRRPQQRAINSAEYHRNNIERNNNNVDRDRERPRERHGERGERTERDRGEHRGEHRGGGRGDGRRVHINSRAEEM